jgi:hypothetical protein
MIIFQNRLKTRNFKKKIQFRKTEKIIDVFQYRKLSNKGRIPCKMHIDLDDLSYL